MTQATFVHVDAKSAAAKAKGGHGVRTAVDSPPPFLAAANLKPLIDKEISRSTTPIEFLATAGVRVFGYPAELLPEVCRVYLSAPVGAMFAFEDIRAYCEACELPAPSTHKVWGPMPRVLIKAGLPMAMTDRSRKAHSPATHAHRVSQYVKTGSAA